MRLLALLAFVLITGCTTTREPALHQTATPVPPSTDTPAPTATVEQSPTSFDSGGLGLSKSEFETKHKETGPGYFMGTMYDDNLTAAFRDDKIWYIEQQWANEITPEDVEAISATLIPADSVFIETYSPNGRPETTVNLYMSESLKSRFEQWIGGEAGNFIVQYKVFDGKVPVMLISIGNNP